MRLAGSAPVGIMVRIEGDGATSQYRVTVKCPDEMVAKALFAAIKTQLGA